MSEKAMGTAVIRASRSRIRAMLPVLAVATASLLAGCAHRDSITVGSVPDDYRTNHPIVLSEKEQKIDIPILASNHGMTGQQRETVAGFLSGYDTTAAPVLTILTPSGSANEPAARAAAKDFGRLAVASGVRKNRISVQSYQVGASDVSAPVRLAYTSLRAQTDKCGRWPDDLLKTDENKHYADFGCSYQNNLAAQMANPADLIGPRKQTEIDAENRSEVIDVYRTRGISDEFLGNSEVSY